MDTDNGSKNLVLVVDDDITNLNVLIDALSQENLNVSIAKNGEESLEQAKLVNPDIILLDVVMPGIDGFETCRKLKEQSETKDIPIIFITALSETINKVTGFNAGGVDYITKPFQYEEVIARVNSHLTIRNQQKYIEKQNKKLTELNRSKDKFFSIIAHDLRNTLTSFLSFSKILKDFELMDKETRQSITKSVYEASENLFNLFENLLNWAKMQQGLLKLESEYFSLNSLVIHNFNLFSQMAEQKKIELINEITTDYTIYGDKNMIDTVLRNLISNALKFTKKKGQVKISANVRDKNIHISVKDSGVGISDEMKASIFKISNMEYRDGTEGEIGTGLGLILCKEFSEKNGGDLYFESETEKGSCFTLCLPAVNKK